MGTQRGRNRAGLTGIVDLPGLGSDVKFRADIGRWNGRMAGETRERRGRGGGMYSTIRWLFSSGSIVCSGELQSSGWPAPSTWRGESGTITIQITEGKTVAYPVEVTVAEPFFDVKHHDFPQVAFTCFVTGEPVYTGWPGTQPAAGTKTKLDQIQWLNSFKNLDPKGLNSTSQRLIDIWGALDDTDTAEQSKLLDVMAASLPPVTVPHSMKLRSSVYARDALDGGTVTETWGLTDTQEDIENEGTFQKVDPDGLGNVAQVTLLDATPNAPVGLVSRGLTTREINDSHDALTLEAGRRSTVDDVEMDGSDRVKDPLDLESQAADTVVYDTLNGLPLTPALPLPELQHVSTRTQEIDRIASKATFGFDILNSEQKQTFPRIKTTDDAQNIEDEAIRVQVWNTTIGAPATPTDVPTNNVKIVTFADVPLAPATATVPAKFVRVWLYGPRNSRDKLVLPETETVDDPQDLASTAMRAALDGETIIDPPGYVYRTSKLIPITDGLAINRTLTVKVYGLRSTKGDVEMPGRVTAADPLKIESESKWAEVYDTAVGAPLNPAAPLSELQVTATETEELNTIRSVKRTRFEVLNSEQKRTYPKIQTTDDANNLKDDAVRAQFWEPGAVDGFGFPIPAPALPDDPPANNVKLIDFTDVPITPAKNMRVWLYGPRNGRDDVVLPNHETNADATNIGSDAIRAGLDGETITDPAGYVLRETITRPITEALGINRTLTIKRYGLRTQAEDITFPNTWAALDPLAIDSKAKDTDIYTTSSGPGLAPPVPSAELQAVSTRTRQVNQLVSEREVEFDTLNSEQKRGFPRVVTTDDANNIEDDAVRYKFFDHGGLAPAAPDDPPTNNVKLIHVSDHRITPARDMRLFVYGPRSSRDKLVLPHHETVTDPAGLESVAVRAGLDGETIVDPVGYVLRTSKSLLITEGLSVNRTLTIKFYGLRTTAEDETMPGTSVETDPEALESKAQETFVYNSAGIAPTELDATILPPTDTKVIGELIQEINQVKSKKLIKWGVRTSEEEITWLKSRRQVETGMLDIFALVVEITASATPDGSTDNPDVTNLSLHHSESHRLTDTQWVHLHEFRPFTATEALQEAGTLLVEDPVTELIGDSQQRQVNSSTTAPLTPTPTLGGTVCVRRTMKRVGKARYQWDWYFGYRSNAAKLEADRTKTTTDPDGLADEHFTADVWTVSLGAPIDPIAPTGLKKVEHTDLTLENPAFTLRIYHWARLGHADRLVFPRTTGRTDGILEPETAEGSIVTIATTLAAQASTEHASRKGTLTYGGIEIVRLNSTKALLTARTIPNVLFISDSIDTHWRDWPSAGSNVIVSEVQTVEAAAFYWAKIVPYRELTEEGVILIKRRVLAMNHNAALTNTALRGLVNSLSFLGHAIGTVLYAGRTVVGEYNEGTNHVYEVIDRCRYSSHGWLDDSQVSYGWNKATADPGIGQQTASTFGWTILSATTGDISGLLT